MIMSDWDKAKTQALKVLGDGAEIPDLPDSVMKASKSFQSANDEFKVAREASEAKLLELDNVNSAFLNALQQFRARVEKSDFKLDAKKDAKKIQLAQKSLTGEIDLAIKELQSNDKVHTVLAARRRTCARRSARALVTHALARRSIRPCLVHRQQRRLHAGAGRTLAHGVRLARARGRPELLPPVQRSAGRHRSALHP